METITKQNVEKVFPSQLLTDELKQLAHVISQAVDVEKIICFGSICHRVIRKSCFEEADCERNNPRNSYNLLVIPSTARPMAVAIVQQQAEEAAKPIAEVAVIVHTMEEVNAALQRGSTFFTTICQKGIQIHDSGAISFRPSGAIGLTAKRIIKREQFWNKWHSLAQGFLQGAAFYQNNGLYRLAVYLLHQAAQHCYCGVLRVMVGYRTNAQSLDRLLCLIDTSAPHLSLALPRQSAEDDRLVELLSKGYTDARYKDAFNASEEQVAALIDRISVMIDVADRQCRLRIQQLKANGIPYIAD